MRIKSKIIFVVVFVAIVSIGATCKRVISDGAISHPDAPATLFAHPGVINNQADLDYLASESGERAKSYIRLLGFLKASPVSSTFPAIVYVKASGSTPTEGQLRKDADIAYGYALKWVKTGAPEDAEKAIKILNGWSKNFTKYDAVEGTKIVQAQLEAAWIAPTFVAVAEIIRHYKRGGKTAAGWAEKDIEQFSKFLINLQTSYINLLIADVDAGKRQNNWGSSAGYAKMAIGVFLDNKADYDDGKRIIDKLLPVIIKSSGEVYELCSRDCHHPQYSTTGLTYAAEIARVQGDESIYKAYNNRLETGYQWLHKAFLGQIECRDCGSKNIYPGVEVAAQYYKSSAVTALAKLQRPYSVTGDHTFAGFTTYSHFDIK